MREAPKRVIYKQKTDHYAVGEKIREQREAMKLSQDKLADMLGSTRKMVSLYENGTREMGINTFIQYCDALNVKPDRLLPERLKECGKQSKAIQLAELASDLTDEDMDHLIWLAQRLRMK